MRSKKFQVLWATIFMVLVLLAVPFVWGSTAQGEDEAATTSYAPASVDATTSEAPPYLSCSAGFCTGLTSLVGNMSGHNTDVEGGHIWTGVELVIPEEGNRYLKQGDRYPLLNEKGISLAGAGHFGQVFPPYPGTAPYVGFQGKFELLGELMRTSDSAAEYVQSWSEYVTEYGDPGGADGQLVVDPKEGYCFEVVNFVYGDPANHNIIGPMTDNLFAMGNFFIAERLKKYEQGIGAGYTRAKRVWELLIDRQYDCIVMQPSPPAPGGGITLPYFMSVWRDHGNLSPEEGKMSCYVPEERGEGALCIHGILEHTADAFINVSRPDHTDLFSCVWVAPGQPCIAPFLPLYIGINNVPEAANGPGNTLAVLFEELRLAVERHPKYRQEITQHWTVFEIQAIEESYGVEKNSASLAEGGDVDGARDVLTKFCEKKCAEALATAKDMLKFLNKRPILGETTEVSAE
jgi:hypothetical protein